MTYLDRGHLSSFVIQSLETSFIPSEQSLPSPHPYLLIAPHNPFNLPILISLPIHHNIPSLSPSLSSCPFISIHITSLNPLSLVSSYRLFPMQSNVIHLIIITFVSFSHLFYFIAHHFIIHLYGMSFAHFIFDDLDNYPILELYIVPILQSNPIQ